jgi:hypothetical protein
VTRTTIEPVSTNWSASIDGALSAYFKQADGTSRPGTHWSVTLKNGEREYKTLVLTYLADTVSPEEKTDTEWQYNTVLRYVFDKLGQGWLPEHGEPPPITLTPP